MLGMHGVTLWLYFGVLPLEVGAAVALFVPLLRHPVDETLKRLVGTALILRERGHAEASACLLRSVEERYGRKTLDVAMRAVAERG
jgi:hypothetical protein